jgi:TRAP-type C4-dicarboxylate transport system substrate-binding protein
MNMKKLAALSFACIFVFPSLAGCNGSASPATTSTVPPSQPIKGEYVLIAASTYNDDYHYVIGMREFEKEVEEKSNGRIDVQVYGSGSIVADDRQSVEMLCNNEIQFGMADTTQMSTVLNEPRLAAACIPYYFPSDLHTIYKIMDKGKGYQTLFDEIEENSRVRLLGATNGGRAVIINTVRETDSMESLKGLKIRTAENPIVLNTVKNHGCNPTPMSWGEVYTGLQQNTIEGCFSNLEGMYNMKFFERCKYVLDYPPFYILHLYGYSADFYDSLPADLQAVLDEAGANYMTYVREHADQNTAEIGVLLEQEGVTVTIPDASFAAELVACQKEWIAESKAAFPDFIEILDEDIANLG